MKTTDKDSLLSALRDNVREKEKRIKQLTRENRELKEEIERKEVTKMPKAICQKCKKTWWGWALLCQEHQTCECGEKLELELPQKEQSNG